MGEIIPEFQKCLSGSEPCRQLFKRIENPKKETMIATDEQIKEMEKLARPLIKFLNDNFHPHVSITVDPGSAELKEHSCRVVVDDYIQD